MDDTSVLTTVGDNPMALRTATPAWKREMVARLDSLAGGAERRRAPLLRRTGWWISAAAAAAILFVSTSASSALWLLERSGRPFEFRMVSEAYQPVTHSRGATGEQSVSLLAAKLLIALRTKVTPASAPWLHAQARANLLGQGGSSTLDSAIDTLSDAQASDPPDVSVRNDLAIALLLRAGGDSGSVQVRAEDVSRAIEVLREALKLRQDPELYFNLALAYEQQRAYHEALDTWKQFLDLEPKGGWAEEAQQHVQALKSLVQARATNRRRRAEDAITPLAAQGFHSTAGLDPESSAKELAVEHHDPWLSDFLVAEKRNPHSKAVKDLQDSVRAFTSGDASTGVERARRAAAAFSADGNLAGTEFALFEQAYSLQRLSDANTCASVAAGALPGAARSHYRWVEVQLRLVLGICLTMLQHFDAGYEQIMTGQQVAQAAGYSSLDLRSMGMASSTLREVGSYREALAIDTKGLERYWSGEGIKYHEYQFYFGLATSLSGLGYAQAAASPMAEAVRLASELPDRATEAMARSRYGTLLIDAVRVPEAEEELAKSEQIFDTVPESGARTLYRSYSGLSLARLDAQENRPERGLARVAALEGIVAALRNESVEIDLWHVKSELLTRAGRLAESEDSLRQLLTYGNSALQSAPSAGDRSSFARSVTEAVGVLVERYIAQQNPQEAWRIWTQYNSCFQTINSGASDSVRLVYANLHSGPVVMVAKNGGVNITRLPKPLELVELTSSFRRAVSDPRSSIVRVRELARRLRTALVDPIQGRIEGARTIYLAAEDPFSRVPFGALLLDDGSWFADHYQIIYSPPLGGAPVPQRTPITSDLPLLAASYGRSTTVFGNSLDVLDNLEEEVNAARAAFPKHREVEADAAQPAALVRGLESAAVFHFSGHAISLAGDAALVLAPNDSEVSSERLLWVSRIPEQSLRHLRLAVLAACSTGRSDPNRYPGADMARAFLLDGVPRVLASSWDVDSRATSELIRGFYTRMGTAHAPEEALSASAAELRKRRDFAHPYYWAAFNYFER
jgi:CHAT domain-containing protein/cytochrome c-type biogenesis protein CcmH/NrfG